MKQLSILVLGEMCFGVTEDEMETVFEIDADKTLVEEVQKVISHEDADFLCDVGEDYVTGTNDTGLNPDKLKVDSYFVDTLHRYNRIDNICGEVIEASSYSYTKALEGDWIAFDTQCRVACGFSDEDELLEQYPDAKKMVYDSEITHEILLS